MYNNYLKVTVNDKTVFSAIFAETSWQEQDSIVKLMADNVPLRLREIIPTSGYYKFCWDTVDSYMNVINGSEYNTIVTKLNEYSVTVAWVESLPS